MRIQPLASGSDGNATLIEAGPDRLRVLVDAGLDVDSLEARLHAIGVAPASIHAVLVTHRHKDHVRGATDFAVRHRCKVVGSRRTLRSVGSQANRRKHTVAPGNSFSLGALRGRSFAVPHDAPEAVGFRLWDDHHIYGHATDLGSWDDGVVAGLSRCHAIYLEFNHDPDRLLACEDYARQLKERIGGDTGHLSNPQAEALLRTVAWPGLRAVILAHLSRRTNTPEWAEAHARRALGTLGTEVSIAAQDAPSPAIHIEEAAKLETYRDAR